MVRAGEPAAVIRCGKRRATIPAPVTGRVVARSTGAWSATRRGCTTTRTAAGGSMRCSPRTPRTRGCRTATSRASWFSREAIRLSQFFEHQLGMAAADGGELVAPAPSLLTESQWDEMTESFLQASK